MASSRRSLPADAGAGRSAARARAPLRSPVDDAVARMLDAAPSGTVAVALSGGRDSMVLLDSVATLARGSGRTVIALHVHHGLSPNADHWAAFCAQACAARSVPLHVMRVVVHARARRSLEAEARTGRYAALASAAREQGAVAVALAHHQDDQAETLLLQLGRGAGPAGLAGMPACSVDDDGLAWTRPFLALAREVLASQARQRGLAWIDDESNDDTRLRRNAVRSAVVPAFSATMPGYPATIARAAALQAESAGLLDDLGALDAAGAFDGATLDRAALAALSDSRARNLLRWFLRGHRLPAPSHARLAAMLDQLTRARSDARVRLAHAGVEIGIHRGRIAVHAPPPVPYALAWCGEGILALPHGELAFRADADAGLSRERLAAATVSVRSRAGGERIQLALGRPRRALKALLHDAGIAPWERASLPLVYCGDALAAVPGIGVDVAFRAAPGAPAIAVEWRPTR